MGVTTQRMVRVGGVLAAASMALAAVACGGDDGDGNADAAIEFDVAQRVDGDDWRLTAVDFRGQNGDQIAVSCDADGDPHTVWGTDVYSDDSSICTAGVHAGAITFADGGTVVIEIAEGRDSYDASERNGVESISWPDWDGSFIVLGAE